MIKLTQLDVAAILERHLARLYNIKKHIKKTGGSTSEIDHSIEEVQSIIENLSGGIEDNME